MRSFHAAVAAIFMLSSCQNGSGPSGTTITNVQIVDGTGSPAVSGAVRIVGDTIVAVGDVAPVRGDSVVDGGGMVLAPASSIPTVIMIGVC